MRYTDEPCPHCERFANRGVSVDAIIMNDNKILLIKRGVEPFKGYWGTPGGYVGWDETAEDAAIREVEEETGLNIAKLRFVCINTDPNRHPQQTMNIVYVTTELNGEVKKGDDAVEARWFEIDSLPEELAFDHKDNIKKALEILKN